MATENKGVPNLRDAEISAIITAVKKRLPEVNNRKYGMMRCYELAAEDTGYEWKTIQRVWRMLQPTTGVAVDYIRARALRMAMKIVKEGSVSDFINVLERPNIGVLDPIKKQEGGGGGFFISVQADSCGAVNVGITQGQPQEALSPAPPQIEAGIIDVTPLEAEARSAEDSTPTGGRVMVAGGQRLAEDPNDHRKLPRGPGNSPSFQRALEAAKVRLEKKRKNSEKHQARKLAKTSTEKTLDTPQNDV